MPTHQSSLGAAGALDVKKVLKTEEIVVAQHADTIEVPPAILGDTAAILTRLRFHDHDVTYDVIGWNGTTGTLTCQRVA